MKSGTRGGQQRASRRRVAATGVDSDVAVPTIRNDKREAKNRRQKVVAGRTRQRERWWNEKIEGERERFSPRRGKNSGVVASLSSGSRPRKIHTGARGAESGGAAVVRLPFLGCTGAKMIIGRHGNARPTSFRFYPEYSSSTLPFHDPFATPNLVASRSLFSSSISLSLSSRAFYRFSKGRGGEGGPNEWRSRNRVLFLLKIFRRAATCHPRSLH